MPADPRGSGCACEKAACDKESEKIPMAQQREGLHDNQPCCGPAILPAPPEHERAGYALCRFVKSFLQTAAGPVPVVRTRLDRSDRLGSVSVRLGINRKGYRIAPGIYAVGAPGPAAPVLVTANYKLTFDRLRSALSGADAWILVLETYGINVWCAAGKGTFSTQAVIGRVKRSSIEKLVTHRRLVLPQLSATGVSARAVKRGCGFSVTWGPVRARDVVPFLENGGTATDTMRQVTFGMGERLALVPVEIAGLPGPALRVLAAVFILSGIGPGIFSLSCAWSRGGIMAAACIAGVFAGAIVTPTLLPWLPGRAFAVKGLVVGTIVSLAAVAFFAAALTVPESVAIGLIVAAISSFLAMNFTGSTPFTSPSGVEREMRCAIPMQIGAVFLAAVVWVGAAFAG